MTCRTVAAALLPSGPQDPREADAAFVLRAARIARRELLVGGDRPRQQAEALVRKKPR